jgi:hypothetical protein
MTCDEPTTRLYHKFDQLRGGQIWNQSHRVRFSSSVSEHMWEVQELNPSQLTEYWSRSGVNSLASCTYIDHTSCLVDYNQLRTGRCS